MADIDLQGISPSAPQAGDMDVVRRGAAAPFNMALVPSITQEVIDARGDRMNLNNRITAIANFASPNGAAPFVGEYYDNNFHAVVAGTFACATNRINAVPFISSQRLKIDRLGIVVTTAHASLARCLIYGSDPNTFFAQEPLFTGGLELDCSTTGVKEHILDFTFDNGRQYWLAVNTAGTPTIRGCSVNSSMNFGLTSGDSASYRTLISRNGVDPSLPPPNPFNTLAADVVNLGIAIPSIRMRAAAL